VTSHHITFSDAYPHFQFKSPVQDFPDHVQPLKILYPSYLREIATVEKDRALLGAFQARVSTRRDFKIVITNKAPTHCEALHVRWTCGPDVASMTDGAREINAGMRTYQEIESNLPIGQQATMKEVFTRPGKIGRTIVDAGSA
jgi:hypothetical protein